MQKLFILGCDNFSTAVFSERLDCIKELKIYDCKSFSTIDGLNNLPSLTILDLHSTVISSIGSLRNHTVLTTININNTKVASLEPLTNVTTLTKIEANNCYLTSLQGVENLKSLNYLDVSNNSIVNLYYLDLLRKNVGNGSFALATLNLGSNSLVNSDVIALGGTNTKVNNIQIITELYSKGLHNINISGNDSLDKTDFKGKNGIVL